MNFVPPGMERRLAVFAACALVAALLGFFLLSNDHALRAIIYGGYWAVLAVFLLFLHALARIARAERDQFARWRERPRWPAVLVAGAGVLLLVHENYGFKILMDEAMLLGTSMSLHFEKMALVPMRGHDILGAFELLGGELDKRPLFQPFLVSLLHDLTGYRPENVFVLNSALTFVLLWLAYLAGTRLAGRAGGALAVLLLAGLPLLAQNATGGGFELLNLVMILSTFLLTVRFLRRGDGDSADALFFSAVLLAMTRYESVLFLLPVALVFAWRWWTERRVDLTWLLSFAPLFLVPYVLHNRVFRARATAWELESQPGYDTPFSLAYVPDNFAHALNFFLDTTGEQSNSLVLGVLGLIALPFLGLAVIRTLRQLPAASPERAALAFISIGFAAHTLLMLAYFWGRFDEPVIRRLSLPLNLAMALALVAVAAEFRRPALLKALIAAAVLGLVAHALPSMARHDYSLDYSAGRETEWRREFIAAHPERDYLLIDNDCIIWIGHLVSGTPVRHVRANKDSIVFNFRNRVFSDIYVFQRFSVDPATGELTIHPVDDLGPDYELEPVWERRFVPLTVTRISRVRSIREGPAAPPPPPAEAVTARLSEAEREKIRQEYLDNFVKKLP